jgi:hypothetical protein
MTWGTRSHLAQALKLRVCEAQGRFDSAENILTQGGRALGADDGMIANLGHGLFVAPGMASKVGEKNQQQGFH